MPLGDSIQFGLGMVGCHQCAPYNNTVVGAQYALRTQNNNSASNGWPQDAQTVDLVFYNNILANNGTATSFNHQGTLSLDYNNYFGTANAPTQTHPILGDPRFVSLSTGDVHLQTGSPAINASVTLA